MLQSSEHQALPTARWQDTYIQQDQHQRNWHHYAGFFDAANLPDVVPNMTAKPHACCPGYFCPPILTCMIPCPLGASCQRCDPALCSYSCLECCLLPHPLYLAQALSAAVDAPLMYQHHPVTISQLYLVTAHVLPNTVHFCILSFH